ncbi:hypothetical protein Y032_0079g1302 [Ancylostoma ceylanicum]|uniref:Miro-like protein n=1 Tax=Ancylostoma ceylanicum TaxID=53326 RepID=A0A016TUD8_9BILA|nr:hypothetical protein Y032_0079g1302 [Ancylostoma ceylanicum]
MRISGVSLSVVEITMKSFSTLKNHSSPKSPPTKTMKDVTRPPKKILVLGPCKAGKTAISNYLGEQVDMESLGEYRPTKGVRIVEFESHELEIHQQRVEVDVELWDCSGDERYRDCWPALLDSIEGVILVANPDENKGEDLRLWYQEFIAKSNLDPENVLVVLNEVGEKRTNDGAISEFQLPPQLSSAVCAACNLQHEGDQLRLEFNQFLMTIIAKSEGY